MQEHEHFEELCALVPIGQLTAAEYQELAEHLKTCSNCRHATEDFALILDQLPISEIDADEKTLISLQRESYRDRFLKRASEEGIPFSEELLHSELLSQSWHTPVRRTSYFLAFAAAATAVVVFAVAHLRQASPKDAPATAQANQSTAVAADNEKSELIAQQQASIQTFANQTAAQKQVIASLQNRLKSSEIYAGNTGAQLVEAKAQLAQLQARLEDADKSLAATRIELASAHSAKDQEDIALVEQQFKLTALSEQLKTEQAAADRERQLSQAVGDGRDLMGARNLHIIDVSDVDGDGKAKKSFGRVFLTEGKSLIFYAFDLGNKGNAAKVSFQAWGQWEGQNRVPKNLGIFRIDDSAQRRWVVKVEDPEKLRDINTLFVTVEPLGGAARPTGKRLLYAYFGLQPNHP